MKYVVGFAFAPGNNFVYLIKKSKPEWQAGLLNGIGGKVEPYETDVEAMRREFKEETGVEVPNWKYVGTMENYAEVPLQETWSCMVFATELSVKQMYEMDATVNRHYNEKAEEPVEVRSAYNLNMSLGVNSGSNARVISNVPLLVTACQFALDKDLTMDYFHINI